MGCHNAGLLGRWASMHHLPDCTQTSSFAKATGQLLIWVTISCEATQARTMTQCQTRASRAGLFLSLTACCNLGGGGFSMLQQLHWIIMRAPSHRYLFWSQNPHDSQVSHVIIILWSILNIPQRLPAETAAMGWDDVKRPPLWWFAVQSWKTGLPSSPECLQTPRSHTCLWL